MGGHEIYSEDVRIACLLAVEQGVPYHRISAQFGPGLATISNWKRQTLGATAVVSDIFVERHKAELVQRWLTVQHALLDKIEQGLEGIAPPANWHQMQSVGILAGIATTKIQDLTEGRTSGARIAIDNRQQTVALDGLDLDTLRWLRSLPDDERAAALRLAGANALNNEAGDTLGPPPRIEMAPVAGNLR